MTTVSEKTTCPNCLKEYYQYPYRDGSHVCPDCRYVYKGKLNKQEEERRERMHEAGERAMDSIMNDHDFDGF